MSVEQIIDQAPNELLNVLLVFHGVRQAALLEVPTPLVQHYIQLLDGMYSLPYYGHLLISMSPIEFPETDEEMGRFLGFACPRDDFANWRIPRRIVEIYETATSTQLYVEICDPQRAESAFDLAESRVEQWNQLMIRLGLKYRFVVEETRDDGPIIRWDQIENPTYFDILKDEYLHDLENRYFPESRFVQQPDTVERHWDLFKYIYHLIHLGNVWNRSERDFGAKIARLERRLWRASPEDYDRIVTESGLLL
jgi:hypothetical protein